jgi:DNA modification methylase
MKIEWIDIKDIRPNPRNSRVHSDEQVRDIARSITEFGWTVPLLVDEFNMLLAGHGRLLAAKTLFSETVPVHRKEGLTEGQKRAYVIADNQLAQGSEWDKQLLGLELRDLMSQEFDVSVIGFGDEEINRILRAEEPADDDGGGWTDEDSAPAAPEKDKVVSRARDVWVCGKHRVMCGDSTSVDDVRLLCDGSVDAWVTDPPYNLSYEGGTKDKLTIKNDSMSDDKFREFLRAAYLAADASMKPGAAFYIWHADSEGFNFRGAARDVGWPVRQCLIWRKSALVLGRQDYHWQHEPCLYGWKPGAAHRFFGGRKQTTISELTGALPFLRLPDGRWQISHGDRALVIPADAGVEEVVSSVVCVAKPSRNEEHPTMKPVSLIEQQVLNSTGLSDLVLDSFGGSGTTLIACQKVGRLARLMELDARYCDVIVKRWQDYVGREATLEGTGETFASVEARRLENAELQ